MSVDIETVRRVARLARIAVTAEEAERMSGELNHILGFVEQLNEVDVTGVEPMTSVIPMAIKERQDVVTILWPANSNSLGKVTMVRVIAHRAPPQHHGQRAQARSSRAARHRGLQGGEDATAS